eukprot:scaffold1311_cov256-Pinguiococcus_pyrenoidosus.AAC.72
MDWLTSSNPMLAPYPTGVQVQLLCGILHDAKIPRGWGWGEVRTEHRCRCLLSPRSFAPVSKPVPFLTSPLAWYDFYAKRCPCEGRCAQRDTLDGLSRVQLHVDLRFKLRAGLQACASHAPQPTSST